MENDGPVTLVEPSVPAGEPHPSSDDFVLDDRPTKTPMRSAVELGVGLVSVVVVGLLLGLGDILLVVACIIVMIMVHELGHLLAAKRGGMKVTEYFLGFGPRLWSIRRGETEYGVKAFPLGGYVKIPGMTSLEEVDPEDEPRTYRQQPFHARLLVAVAGSAMHFLMAFVLLWVLLVFVGVPNGNQVAIQQVNAVGGQPGPAQVGGLRPGDVLVSVDGHPVHGDPTPFVDAIHSHVGTPITVVVDRHGQTRTLSVVPVDGRAQHETGVQLPAGTAPFGVVGVGLGSPTSTVGPLRAVTSTGSQLTHFTWASMTGVVHLFSPTTISSRFQQVSSAKAADQATADGTRVESIYGAVRTAGQAVHAGVGDLLLILISLNVFIGIFNLFPMLPLDGGHVAIAVYEKIRTGRSKVLYHADVTKLLPFTWLMVAFLGVLFVTSFLTDILHPMANPFG